MWSPRPDPNSALKRVRRRINGSGHRRRGPEEQPESRPHDAVLPRHGSPDPDPVAGVGAQTGLHLFLDTHFFFARREE